MNIETIERIKEEKGSENAREGHYKNSYFLQPLLSEEVCLFGNRSNPFLTIVSSYVWKFEDKRKRLGKKLLIFLDEIPVSFSSNLIPLCSKFCINELKLYLNAYASHEIALGKLFSNSLICYQSFFVAWVRLCRFLCQKVLLRKCVYRSIQIEKFSDSRTHGTGSTTTHYFFTV